MPVIFPPGWARLATKPNAIGSFTCSITMGVVALAFLAAVTAPAPPATMTSTFNPTSSSASSDHPDLPLLVRNSITTFLTLDVTEIPQALPECLGEDQSRSCRQITYSENLLRLLRLGYHSQQQAVPLQSGLMTPQPSSLRTSFRALCITRIEIKESVIYTAEGDRD